MKILSLIYIKSIVLGRWIVSVCLLPFRMMMQANASIHVVCVYQSEADRNNFDQRINVMINRAKEYLETFSIELIVKDSLVESFNVHPVSIRHVFSTSCAANEKLAARIQKTYADKKLLTILVADKIPTVHTSGFTVGGYMGFSNYILLSMQANALTLAHEIGHAQGLIHVKDADNLMCSGMTRTDHALSEFQALMFRYGLFATITAVK